MTDQTRASAPLRDRLAAVILRSWQADDERVYPPGAPAPDPLGLAEVAAEALLSLPVEQRMALVGMRKAVWDDIDVDLGSPIWVEAT